MIAIKPEMCGGCQRDFQPRHPVDEMRCGDSVCRRRFEERYKAATTADERRAAIELCGRCDCISGPIDPDVLFCERACREKYYLEHYA